MINLLEERKRRAEKIAWFLQIVPFIRFVGLTGSLALEIARENSDIDIFIVAKHKRIWTCRHYTLLVLKMLGLKRTGDSLKEKAGKICANSYVTDRFLEIHPQNTHQAQYYSQMVPLFDNDMMYRKFLEKNIWMEKYGYFPPRRAIMLMQSAGILSTIRKIAEWVLSGFIGVWLERKIKQSQIHTIRKHPLAKTSGSEILVSDEEIQIYP